MAVPGILLFYCSANVMNTNKMLKQTAIVITSIASPTKAVRKYADLDSTKTIVVGDTKTPDNWHLENVIYLSVEQQLELFKDFGSRLPVAHYSRKNIGYLEAIRRGYQVIVDTDDDNIPLENWYIPDRDGVILSSLRDQGFINIYSYFTDQHIWPRGLPLDCVQSEQARAFRNHLEEKNLSVPIWQGLANGDADVDAIYRLVNDSPCVFESRVPVALGIGTVSPYNSQNTISYKEAFPLLYLPSHVSFRFTDILRGLIGQVILWDHDYRLGFFKATVFQERNIHDYFNDFKDEIPVYLNTRNVIEIAQATISSGQSMQQQLSDIYRALAKENIVGPGENELVDLWLNELDKLDL